MSAEFPNAPTNLDLNNFRSSLNKAGGIARIARFAVVIRPVGPNNLLTRNSMNPRATELIYACYQAEYPSRGFTTLPTRYYGPAQMFPVNSEYEPVGMTFICRNNLDERRFFDEWQEIINPTTSFDFAYPENYYSDVVLYQYSEMGESYDSKASPMPKYMWTLRKAWPVEVSKQPVTWQDTEFLFVEIKFMFRYWDRSSSVGEYSGETQSAGMRPGF